ncbi:spermidine/putrescine ABC transporter permease [Hypericibacter terrae]|jgi:spermidine/putrescine transport system permease protein|uniref:Spermidine/putrescine ABC transporter permease n=1 Tax=Hypericibacter terrae TaxID=2602015 RepID=A0A5J6MQF6_9PROT|nr:ABC transporter permease [Hypericibacter terrae]QEX19634.1 spermidine/putrescine ABC transporter permease [Hypericibacter terrae]
MSSIALSADKPRPPRWSPAARTRAGLLALPLGWIALFLVLPCALVVVLSFFERGTYGGIDYIFTLENYSRAADSLYLGILLTSLKIAGLATLIAFVLGYPMAYLIATAPLRWQKILLLLAVLPFWTNYLIRTYAWIVILNRQGLINGLLSWLGLTSEPVDLLYNEFAILVGLVYAYLPFMILPLYAAISRLSPDLIEASTDLGAPGFTSFRRITLPLTVPGAAAGAIFVFVYSMGNFITPDLLGGGRTVMVGNLIYDQFLNARDWPFGSALSFILMGVMMALLSLQAYLVNRARRMGTYD